jgi:hypothetical protein
MRTRDEMGKWYDEKSIVNPGQALWSRFDHVLSLSRLRVELDRFHCSLYHDRAYQGFGGNLSAAEAFLDGMAEKLNENVIFRVVQVLTAKLARQRPKPTVLTDGANWALQQRAKQYDKFIWATLHDQRVYELQRSSDLKMLLAGTGVIYVGSEDGELVLEDVPPWELFVDPAESRYGKPRTLYRRSFIDRGQLVDQYPKHEREITEAGAASLSDAFAATGREDADMVPVITGWRLGSKEKPGKVGVAIEGQLLGELGEYKRDRFPFAVSRYAIAPEGFFGIGVVSQLVGLQVEHNRTLASRQHALRKLGAPHYAVERGSKIVKASISNRMEDVIEYTGQPPHVLTPGVINPETFQHGDRVKSAIFQNGGVSELAASAMKPAGLNSGKAIRAYADMQDDGLHDVMLRREQQILDVAELILDELEDLSEAGESVSATYVSSFGIEKIQFDDVKMDRDSMKLKVQPTSALSTSLAGKLEDLMDLRELGIVTDPQQMQELLQLPDLETNANRQNAMPDLIRHILEDEILGKGKSVVPEPTWNLDLCLKLSIETRLQAQLHNAPADRIELLRVWEKQVIGYMQPEATPAPQTPQVAEPPGMVPGDPMLASPEAPPAGDMPVA